MLLAARLLAVVSLAPLPLLAQLRWEPVVTPQAPAPRYGHATTSYGFLFGGRDQTQAFADSWVLEFWGWLPVATTTAPSARHGHALADRSDFSTYLISEYLLFGGEDLTGTKDGTTWRFTGHHQPVPGGYPVFIGSWQQLVLATAPSPRSGHAMAYDYWNATECLLFGGNTASGSSDETWRFANGAWQQLQPAVRPPARAGHQLLAVSGGWVLCGGADGATPCADSWFFDGLSWQPLPTAPLPGTEALSAWSNRGRHAVLVSSLIGGTIQSALLERTTAGTWLLQEQIGALPQRLGASVFDWVEPELLVLFGGRDAQGQVLGDTLRLVPEHVAATTLIGAGCGPGPWSINNGPDLLAPRLLLGSTGTIRLYTATPDTLVLFGLQLGAAPAPAPCTITVVPELIEARITDAQLLAEVRLGVPFSPALRGLQVSGQALAFEPLAANGIAISRVAVMSVGD